ncbi:MAG: universal stress protein [Pseudomonadota bacterium]|jgi:nucleotide-binding universal stress UspA family protein
MSTLRKILIAIDGSDSSIRAVEEVMAWTRAGLAGELHLVSVQHPVHSAVTTFVGKKEVSGYHYDEGVKALSPAKAKLDAAGLAYHVHIGVGKPADVIVHFCQELKCDAIVMGTRGLGGTAGVLLGSVTRDVIAAAEVPVTLVK